jgi:hypothetical protein
MKTSTMRESFSSLAAPAAVTLRARERWRFKTTLNTMAVMMHLQRKKRQM